LVLSLVTIQKRIHAAFFRTPAGAEPVRIWLRSLPPEEKGHIGDDIALIEFGWPIGLPTCHPLGKGLYEVRTTLKDKIARVFFMIVGNEMVLLHGFIKKSQSTPKQDLDLARTRQRLVESDR
jgi:phage-related protein